jgi:hypothetical protein
MFTYAVFIICTVLLVLTVGNAIERVPRMCELLLINFYFFRELQKKCKTAFHIIALSRNITNFFRKHLTYTCSLTWPNSSSNKLIYKLRGLSPRAAERPPLLGEVSANFFLGYRVPLGQRDGSLMSYSRFSRPEPLLFLSSSSSVVLTRLSGPRSRPTTSQKIW